MMQEYEVPCGSPIAIPYKWEAAPGRPIVEAVPVTVEPWMSPLPPPPGVRKVTKPWEPSFDGFEPKLPVLVEAQLSERILKKLNRLRRRSMVAAACFTSEASRVIEHSGQLFPMEDLDRCAYDSDAMSRCSISTWEQPSTPCSSTSFESSFSEPNFRSRNMSVGLPPSPCMTRARQSARRFKDGECFDDDNGSDDEKTLPGPRESAWHQFSGELERPAVPPKWQIRRSYSAMLPTLLRQSTSSRSLKQLTLGRTFRRSKATKHLDLEKM